MHIFDGLERQAKALLCFANKQSKK
uniref:Uncharacterized protein n=1 Tax=Anguilla anguilla TaxID=7936 RepID=A0A0E9U588_ANGAN